jgi:putative PEP-CTERM system histidine kinase
VLFGVGAILAFFIYISSQALLFSTLKIEILPVVSFVILISSSMMAVFIIKNRLLDADIFVSRYVIYNSFTILIVGFYLLSVGLIVQGIKYFNISLSYFFTTLFVFVSILALVIILFFSSIRRKVHLFINRHFYKHKFEFRDKWMETIEKISSKGSIEDVNKTLAEMITETMGARSVYIWLYEPIAGNYRAIENEMATSLKIITKNHPLIKHIKTKTDPFMINDRRHNGSDMQEDLESLVTETGAVLCAPLIAGDEIVGFILQAEDISGEPYRQDDFEYLKAVTTQAAVQIKTIELNRDLMAAKQAEAFHRLSSFIMHDLKNLTNSLFLVSQNARYHMDNPEFQSDAIKTIDATVSRMKELIERLAGVSKGFQFKKKKVDLKDLVHNALKKVSFNENKNIMIAKRFDPMPPIYVDPYAMETVFLNLFTNSYEAIENKGRISVSASLNGDDVNITISDNGKGIPKEFVENGLFKSFKSTKKNGFGIGLYQSKTILEAHGGKIEFETEEGKGTSFTIKLPVQGAL